MPTPVKKPIIGNKTGHDTIVGTQGDDVIVAYGPDSTIIGDGGVDFINAGLGGALVLIGAFDGSAPSVGLTVVNLQGKGNIVEAYAKGFTAPGLLSSATVRAYTGNVSVVGYLGGNQVFLGDGNTSVSLGSTGNVVRAGEGVNTLRFTGGQNQVAFDNGLASAAGFDDTVLLAGSQNYVFNDTSSTGRITVMGGGGDGVYDLGTGDATIDTGGRDNRVTVSGSYTDQIAPDDGDDAVYFNSTGTGTSLATATVTLQGMGNTISGSAASLTVTDGIGHGNFTFGNTYTPNTVDYGNYNQQTGIFSATPARSYSVTTDGFYNNFNLDDSTTNAIVAGNGYDTVTLAHPDFTYLDWAADSGYVVPVLPDASTIPTQVATVQFGGNYNTLTAQNGETHVTGFGSDSTLTLGNGNNMPPLQVLAPMACWTWRRTLSRLPMSAGSWPRSMATAPAGRCWR